MIPVCSENATFAAAMRTGDIRHILLEETAESRASLHFDLDDKFFASLDQQEIAGGEVCVELSVKHASESVYRCDVEAKGHVVVACDRCLEPLPLEVYFADSFSIKDAPRSAHDDGDLRYMEAGHSDYDASWDIYELVETSLPLQRIHPEGQCNEEMLARFTREADEYEG